MMPLLPNEPRVADERQQGLTERYLLPALASIEALFLHLRAGVDPELSARKPEKLGRPYPLGQGLEIVLAMQEALRTLDPSTLPPRAVAGHAALAAFLGQGGNARTVWGALHGARLHHAFLFGTLYVDVACDTNVPAAVPVALRPFAQARMTPVRDHRHFALLAQATWDAQVYPNHVLPDVAPYAPLVMLVPGGCVQLEPGAEFLHGLTAAQGFAHSAAVLDAPAMPADLFQLVAGTLAKAGIAAAHDPAQGRTRALALCRGFRDARRHPADGRGDSALALLARANASLQTLSVSVTPRQAA